jgi:putative transposase
MDNDLRQQRISAVKRYLSGESPEAICTSLGKSKVWLYKWIHRYKPNDDSWCNNLSTKPKSVSNRTSQEIEEIVMLVRLSLYNKDLFYGAQAILWELEDLGVKPLPSLRTINRILSRNHLTHRRTGKYEAKGTPYPKLPTIFPNQTHQADMVGPCYLKGPIRFYSLNVIDLATERCGLNSCLSRDGQTVINSFWSIWKRMGIPVNIQIDNAMYFYGSPTHPRGMGPLIRLCLHNGVEPWFIPVAEPWRNGAVEHFNNFYQQRFLDKLIINSVDDLKVGTLAFEQRHNSKYRYSKLGGKTPIKALAQSKQELRFPDQEEAPKHRLRRPETGRYHLVRFIRSNRKLDIFGELFPGPAETEYQYVVATIDVKEQKLKVFLYKSQIDEIDYKLR